MRQGLPFPLVKLNFFRKGGIVGDTLILGGAQALGYLLPLAATPILIHRVGVQEYGLFALVQVLGLLTQAVVDYGFSFTATRSVVSARDDRAKCCAILVNVTVAKAGLYAVCLMVAALAALVFHESVYSPVLTGYFPYSLLSVSSLLIPLWYFQGMGDVHRAAIFTGLARVVSLVALFFFVHPASSLVEIALLYTVPGVVVAGYFWFTALPARPDWRLLDWQQVRSLLADGRHIFATNVLSIGLTNAGPLIISTVAGPATVGLYSAAERVAKTISYIYGPLTQAIYPRVVSSFQSGQSQGIRFLKRVMALYLGSGLVLGALAFFGADYIMAKLGAPGTESSLVLKLLAIWVLISIANNVTGLQLLTALGQSRYYMRCFLASALVYLISAFLLTYAWAIIGPAIALMAGETCLFILVAMKARSVLAYDHAAA